MLVVEGMDNSGKSTLAHELARATGRHVVHSPGHRLTPPQLRDWAEKSLFSPANPYIIYDRHPVISESVYGPVLRGKSIFHETWLGRFVRRSFYEHVRPLIIYCRPPVTDITDFRKPEMDGVTDNALKLLSAYDGLIDELVDEGVRVLRYNYQVDEVDELLEQIERNAPDAIGN